MLPSHFDCFQVLLLQLGDDGRRDALLGDSFERLREACQPFLVSKELPDAYFEFPLAGDPFLDVTLLYGEVEPGVYVKHEAAAGTKPIFDWYAPIRKEYEHACFGFELDTHETELPTAGIHFQPRRHTELVEPFCQIAGEPERAKLYLDLDARMPEDWKLSFFGMFRGRKGSPLRVCGYLSPEVKERYEGDTASLARVFDTVGFSAYDDRMLEELSRVMSCAPAEMDFQFDVYPNGSIGDIFAVDVQFGIEQPEMVCETFSTGPGARFMELLEEMGIADKRWRLTPQAAFARALPVVREDGTGERLSFTLMPQWVKVRWNAGVLQPSKMYYLGKSCLLNTSNEH